MLKRKNRVGHLAESCTIPPMSDYERIADVIRFLEKNSGSQPDLQTLADHVDLSPAYLQRLFSRWAGTSPKNFLKCLTVQHAKQLLKDGKSVLATSHEVGLSGPSRLHDLCVTLEAASPGEIKSGGKGLQITAGIVDSPFGFCLIANSPRGVCHLYFHDQPDQAAAEAEIRRDWFAADLKWDNEAIGELAKDWFRRPEDGMKRQSIRTFVAGTDFQVRVWRALLRIPSGSFVSYGEIAKAIEKPKASRAVGTAVGSNEISFLIPCHRVIRESGVLGHYRWGSERKKSMLVWETAAANQ